MRTQLIASKAFARDDAIPKVATLDLLPDEIRGTAGEAAFVNSETSVVRRNRERRNLSSDTRQT